MADRIDAIDRVRPDRPGRSPIAREAMAIGLDVMEHRYGITKGKKS